MSEAVLHIPTFRTDEAYARQCDGDDVLARFRHEFELPAGPDGTPQLYFVGNSLGPMPKRGAIYVDEAVAAWATLGHEARFRGAAPWYQYQRLLRHQSARLVGGQPEEVVVMNALSVNLHLLMATFYRPTPDRFAILTDDPTFPSDIYIVQSQLAHHGFDPRAGHLLASPRPGEETLRTEDVEALLAKRGHEIALVLFAGVNFITGQAFDIARITAAARRAGCVVGWDLAHAAGNVPLELNAWDVDFAAWCAYKYLCGGPGGPGGVFLHERHARNVALPRFAGWWGNDPEKRLAFDRDDPFEPVPTADAWQISNPPILSMAALRASLEIFDEVGNEPRRAKSEALTAYLEFLVDVTAGGAYTIVTPRHPAERGCQLSLKAHGDVKALLARLEAAGVACDLREPDILRFAPHPLYNTFHDVWRLARLLAPPT